jgi:hypothetical protein
MLGTTLADFYLLNLSTLQQLRNYGITEITFLIVFTSLTNYD